MMTKKEGIAFIIAAIISLIVGISTSNNRYKELKEEYSREIVSLEKARIDLLKDSTYDRNMVTEIANDRR